MMLDRILRFDSNWWDCLGRDPFDGYQSAYQAPVPEDRVVA
jgi:hypothetical protein